MLSIIVLLLLIFFTAMLSCSETALFSLSKFTLRNYQCHKDARKRLIAKLLSYPRELLVTILMLNILANVLVQNTFSSIFGNFSSWALKVGVPLFLVLFFGEIIPKSLAIANNKKISYQVSPIIFFIFSIVRPIRAVITFITNYISRLFFFFLKKEEPVSKEELKHMVDTSQKTGILNHDEKELIHGYLDLHYSTVKEKMRPKNEILFYDIQEPLSKLIHLFMDFQCSRVPVCEDGLDRILGIISIKTFFFHQEHIQNQEDVKKLLKKPFFVPEATNAWDLLAKLRESQETIAIVVDEYGWIKGLASQEDLMEEVIGEIEDVRDSKDLYVRSSEDVIIASGALELSDFLDIFGVELISETAQVTIGGWLEEKLESIPQAGEKFLTEEFLFYVLDADPHKVKRIYIRRLRS